MSLALQLPLLVCQGRLQLTLCDPQGVSLGLYSLAAVLQTPDVLDQLLCIFIFL